MKIVVLAGGLSMERNVSLSSGTKVCRALRARLTLEYDRGVPAGAADALRALFTRREVLVEKRTKHKELAQINIVPLLRSVEWVEGDGCVTADVVAAAQNPGLNPALLGGAVSAHLPELTPDFVRVRRLELYDAEMQPFR